MIFKDITLCRSLVLVSSKAQHDRLVELILQCDGANLLAPGHWGRQLNENSLRAFNQDEAYRTKGQLLVYAQSAAHGWRTKVDCVLWIGLIPSRGHPAFPTFVQACNRSPGANVYRHVGFHIAKDEPLQAINFHL